MDILSAWNTTEGGEDRNPGPSYIDKFQNRYRVAAHADLPRFTGGLVGYFGYDTIRYIRPKQANCPNPDPIDTPDILLLVSDEVVVFDNLRGRLYVIVHVDPTDGGTYAGGRRRLQNWFLGYAKACRTVRKTEPAP